MKKILIIGQAPPAQEQKVPYDTTMLYDILGWVGITKEQAQDMFEFEAMSPTLRGVKDGSHLKPLKGEMEGHFFKVLKHKIAAADKVIMVGNVAIKNVDKFCVKYRVPNKPYLRLIHPSRRNYSKIMASKEEITEKLSAFLAQ